MAELVLDVFEVRAGVSAEDGAGVPQHVRAHPDRDAGGMLAMTAAGEPKATSQVPLVVALLLP
ncbi:hypothetical protein ONA91_39880 [Micromonospora sp. DR5-3]|uniref:hypothetical protein n=1 Tax=unclassified Micromonospora TaxID=2617518 RepID=UPI001652781F|nr:MULTISPECIES: hypothetical protein [unclassified Micromonospora]MCW3820610.1 hypothetical protein [Micromonospora sp. DR5-3]